MPRLGLPACVGVIGLLLVMPAGATAQTTGGASAPADLRVTSVRCLPSGAAPCPAATTAVAGGKVRMTGEGLRRARSLIFRGRRGRRDDVGSRIAHSGPRHAEVPVPKAARSGRLDLVTADGARVVAVRRLKVRRWMPAIDAPPARVFFAGDRRRPALTVTAASAGPITVEVARVDDGAVVRTLEVDAQPGVTEVRWGGRADSGPAPNGEYVMRLGGDVRSASAQPAEPFVLYDHVFPIRGKHDLGQSGTNNFGGGRNHRGQDMFAACGTPLVAARGGRVRYAGYHSAAGNYVVVTSRETGRDYVYMHMRSAPLLRTGDRVATRQVIGEVGDSGNASGCHLHFELWSAPGWYAGGEALNPLPALRAWDGWS